MVVTITSILGVGERDPPEMINPFGEQFGEISAACTQERQVAVFKE